MAVSTELESLVATLIGDGSSFQKMMRDAVVQANQTTKVLEQNTDAISKNAKEANEVFGKTIDQLGTKMSNMAGQFRAMAAIESPFGMLKEGVALAADAERLEVAFGTMLRSAEKGKQMIQDLQKFAAETPLELPGLTQVTKTLLQFGVTGENIIPTIRMLGDVANGEQDKLQRLAIAFGQARAAGRLMGEEVAQMREAGFNPLQEISRTTGKSIAQLSDEMGKGRISVEMMEAAFKSATSEGGMFFEGMKNASKTAAGLWSTMQDDIDGFKRSLGLLIIEQFNLKDVMKAVSAVAQELTGWIQNLDSESKLLITILGTAVLSFGALVIAWKIGAIAIGMVVGVLKDVVLTLKWIIPLIWNYAKAVTVVETLTTAWGIALAALPWVAAVAGAAALLAGIGAIVDEVTGAGEAIKTFNAELERMAKLDTELAKTREKAFTKEFGAISGVSDPTDRAAKLQEFLDKMEKNAAGMKASLERSKAELDKMSGISDRLVRSDWVPGIGKAEVLEHKRVTDTIAATTAALEKEKEHIAKVREELGKLTEAAGKPDPAMVKAITELNTKLEEQAATAGKTSAEIELYRLRKLKATEADLAATRSLMEMAEAAKKEADLRKSIDSLVESLSMEIEVMGKSTEEAKLYKLAREGATEADLANARGLAAMAADLEKHNEAMKRGRELVKQYTPEADTLFNVIGEIGDLWNAGAISGEEYDMILSGISEKMADTAVEANQAKKEIQALDSTLSGGAEARRRILEYASEVQLGRASTPTAGIAAIGGRNEGQAAVINRLDIMALLLKDIRDKPVAAIEESDLT